MLQEITLIFTLHGNLVPLPLKTTDSLAWAHVGDVITGVIQLARGWTKH